MKPERLVMHHSYRMYYQGARITCLLWWLFSEEQSIFGMSKGAVAKRAKEGANSKHANAILFPLAYYPIEKYSVPIFEKDCVGKFTLVEDRGVVAVGVVEKRLVTTAPCRVVPNREAYNHQMSHVLMNSTTLFDPEETRLHAEFVKHIRVSPKATQILKKCKK
jgi:hypothetical protein